MGRPVKYSNPDDMQALIHLYFEGCKENRAYDAKGWGQPKEATTEDLHPTVTGLALALDMTREGLIKYEGKDEFADTIKRAKSRVEAYTVQRLFMNNPTGSIFNLKNNFGWKDKTEVASTGADGGPIKTETKWTVEVVDVERDKQENSDTKDASEGTDD